MSRINRSLRGWTTAKHRSERETCSFWTSRSYKHVVTCCKIWVVHNTPNDPIVRPVRIEKGCIKRNQKYTKEKKNRPSLRKARSAVRGHCLHLSLVVAVAYPGSDNVQDVRPQSSPCGPSPVASRTSLLQFLFRVIVKTRHLP